MKRMLTCLLCLAMVLALFAGCGSKPQEPSNNDSQTPSTDNQTPSDASEPSGGGDEKVYHFALVSNGPVTDGDWNENSWRGLQDCAAKHPGKVEVSYSENVAQADYADTFYGYAKDGYDLVIGNGYEFSEAVFQVCDEFPECKFAIVNGLEYRDNVCSFEFDNVEFGYYCGVAMALVALEENTNCAFICAEAIPSYRNFYLGMEAGIADYGQGKVTSTAYYTGDWTDITKGSEMALTAISNNEKVLVPWIGAVNHAIYAICDEQDCKFVSTSFNLGDDAFLDNALMTITQSNDQLLSAGCESVIDGTYPANGAFDGNFANGLNHFESYGECLNDEQRAILDDVLAKLEAGEIDLPEMYKE